MRGPLLGVAFLLGPAVAMTFGGLPACAAVTETADAGQDVYIPPQGCDVVGEACNTCQGCSTTQSSCGPYLQACQGDDGCLALAQCIDECDTEAPVTIADCVTGCCNSAFEETSVQNYNYVAMCVYGTACPESCNLQRTFNGCPSVQ